MKTERVKYILWAADMDRAVQFYCKAFEAVVARKSEVMAELAVAGAIICIHGGGEGKRTWTGLSFQVADLLGGCAELRAAGGTVLKDPEDTPEEPAHLAMCADTEGNEIMLMKVRNPVFKD